LLLAPTALLACDSYCRDTHVAFAIDLETVDRLQTRYGSQRLPTDEAGRAEGECEVARFTAWVLPKRLQEQKALMEFYQANRGQSDPTASVRMNLGTVTPRLGEVVELELRLPPGWDQ
jgi:hypothetical protein